MFSHYCHFNMLLTDFNVDKCYKEDSWNIHYVIYQSPVIHVSCLDIDHLALPAMTRSWFLGYACKHTRRVFIPWYNALSIQNGSSKVLSIFHFTVQ